MLSFEQEFGDWLRPLIIGETVETRDEDTNDIITVWETTHETVGFIETRAGTTAFEMDRRRFGHTHRIFLPFTDDEDNEMNLSPDQFIVDQDPNELAEGEDPTGTRYRIVYPQPFLEYYQYVLVESVE